jgi:hypothetical protein
LTKNCKLSEKIFNDFIFKYAFHRVSPDFDYARNIEIFKGEIGHNFIKKDEVKLRNEELYPWRATMSNSGLNLNLRSNNESGSERWW